MSQTNESRATDPAFASNFDNGLNTANTSEILPATQTKSTLTTDHRRVSDMLGYALTLNDPDTWMGTVQVFKARLSEAELAALSWVSLKAQGPDNAAMTAEAVLGQFGTPIPPLISAMDEAAHWADWAAPTYVKAVVLAGFNRMSAGEQADFLDFVQGRKAA